MVRVIKRKILGETFILFKHVLHRKELIWEHPIPVMSIISLDL